MWWGDGSKTADGVGDEGVMDRGAVHGQREGLITPEGEDSPGSGRTVAPGITPDMGETGGMPLRQNCIWWDADICTQCTAPTRDRVSRGHEPAPLHAR